MGKNKQSVQKLSGILSAIRQIIAQEKNSLGVPSIRQEQYLVPFNKPAR